MRFRFSIRDLLLMTVIVGLATGWWLDHRRLTAPPPVKPTRLATTRTWTPAGPTIQNPWMNLGGYIPPHLRTEPPTFTAPQGVHNYEADDGLLYDERSKATPFVVK